MGLYGKYLRQYHFSFQNTARVLEYVLCTWRAAVNIDLNMALDVCQA